jgi:hypothetical protein
MSALEKPGAETHEDISVHSSNGVLLYGEDGKPRKFPVPSGDPTDPLNFPVWKQGLILAIICIYAVAGFGIVQTTPLFFGNLIKDYKQQSKGVRFTRGAYELTNRLTTTIAIQCRENR